MDRSVTKIITSAGSAYNLDLGSIPDYIECRNITKWTTASQNIFTFWYRGMGAGYYSGYATQSTVTDGLNPITDTSNGFTAYDTSSFAARHILVDTGSTKITKAANAVVTSTAHGLSTGDKVTFNSVTAGMIEINGLRTTITRLGADTFSCDDIDSTGFTTWNSSLATGQFIITSDLVLDAGFKGITLGTIPMANSSDVLIVKASWFDSYDNSVSA